jgi:hypothetical protein
MYQYIYSKYIILVLSRIPQKSRRFPSHRQVEATLHDMKYRCLPLTAHPHPPGPCISLRRHLSRPNQRSSILVLLPPSLRSRHTSPLHILESRSHLRRRNTTLI